MSTGAPVDALVLAAGRGERLGLGPKAWLTLGDRTLLERAIATVRPVASRVIVGVAPADMERARAVLGSEVTVVAGGEHHRETLIAAFRAGDAPVVLIHDVAHPFVTPALARAVIDAARSDGAAVAAVRAWSSAYHEPPAGSRKRLGPGTVWLVRRPFACRRAGLQQMLDAAAGDLGLSEVLARAGVQTRVVPAPVWNIKVTTPDDWALARAIEQSLDRG